jgi:ketosteroid isomerase-like protein
MPERAGEQSVMQIDQLTNHTVRNVFEAMRDGDRESYLAAFSPDAVMTDDGNQQSYSRWADQWLFDRSRGRVDPVHREADAGLTVYGVYRHGDAERFESVWRFQVAAGKVTRLDVARP